MDGWDGWDGWLSLDGAIYRAPTVLIKSDLSCSENCEIQTSVLPLLTDPASKRVIMRNSFLKKLVGITMAQKGPKWQQKINPAKIFGKNFLG